MTGLDLTIPSKFILGLPAQVQGELLWGVGENLPLLPCGDEVRSKAGSRRQLGPTPESQRSFSKNYNANVRTAINTDEVCAACHP